MINRDENEEIELFNSLTQAVKKKKYNSLIKVERKRYSPSANRYFIARPC